MNKMRYTLFAVTMFIVFSLSAMNTVPVLADDTTPPPDTTADPATPPVVDKGTVTDPPPAVDEESAVTDPPPVVDESVITDPPPAVDESAAIDVPLVDTATEPATLPELLDQLPAGTDVIVTDANGDVVPLATEEAAEIIATHDPIWCPTGVAPNPGIGGCTGDAYSLWDLINDGWSTYGQATTSGTIWIEHGYDYSGDDASILWGWYGDTVIDDWSWSGSEGYNLTLQGGWNGTYGSMLLDPIDPYTYFNTTITISGWTGNITINNIVIDDYSPYSYSPSYTDYALDVSTNGSITLNNVTVQNNINTNTSASCSGSNCIRGGAYLYGGGGVTVNNSNFNNNEGTGLVIYSAGAVTTNNIVAAANGGDGVYIDNHWASAAKPVTMKGIKQFVGNGGNGLVVYSYGAVTISNIVATDNGRNGVLINNTYGSYLPVPIYSLVSITGSNAFNNNVNNGLEVYSFGAIAVSNVTALSNGGDGVYLDNCIYGGTYDCLSKSAKTVTVSGTNIFNNNGFGSDGTNGYMPGYGNGCFYNGFEYGLEICSAGGAILLSNITASYNTGVGGGIFADNRLQNYTGQKLAGALTLTGYGVFNGNSIGGWGLEAWTYGPMTLNNVTANDNAGEGAYLRALNVFTLNGYGIFNNNGGEGLHLQTSSAATLNNITANDNGYYGASVTSWRLGDLAFASVTFKGVNTFNGNSSDGLHIETDGAIMLSNVTANDNGGDGADLCNYFNTGSGYLCNNASNVTSDTGTPDGNGSSAGKGITLSGVNTFNGNWTNGLLANSNGAIMISNLTANKNGRSGTSGSGAYLNNYQGNSALTPRLVTLTGPVNVNYNYYRGLEIYSLGAVSLGNITATYNTNSSGVYIVNEYNSIKQNNVTITGLNNQFNNNGYTGLSVYSYGMITLSNITANWNNGYGSYLYNSGGSLVKPVTLSGVNNFNHNYYDGLRVYSDGAVTLSRVTANYNGRSSSSGRGIHVDAYGTITLTCGVAYGNYNNDMDLNSWGGKLVTVKGFYARYYYFSLPNLITKPCLLP